MSETTPFLLTGSYRVGSTWLSLLLSNHDSVVVGLHTTNYLREEHRDAYEAVDYARKRWDVSLAQPDLLNQPPSGEPAFDWNLALRAIFGDHQVLGEKQQLEWEEGIPTFLDWYENGKALLLIRDPRSVLASWRGYCRYDPPNYRQAAFVALSAMQHAIEYGDSLSPLRCKTVQYEALAEHTGAVLGQIIDWLGLDWPGRDVMLSTDGWQDVPGVQWQDRSSFTEPDEIDVDRAVNRWKHSTTTDEVRFVETVCREEMEHFGYEPVSETPMNERTLRDYCSGDELLEEMLERWLETGEGTEAFPEDPTDESTWRENQRQEVASG